MQQNRNFGIRDIKARPGQSCYGMGLGIIILEDVYPGFPGDVRNASAWPFPVQYEIAEGVDINNLVDDPEKNKDALLPAVLAAAKKLERLGCRAVAGECGYFAYFQREVAAELSIPVFMSSMLQVPWAQTLIGPNRTVGILTGAKEALEDRHLEAVGVSLSSNYEVFSFYERCGSDYPEFRKLWSTKGLRSDPPGANFEKAEAEIVTAAVSCVADCPSLGALVLECTGYPPFAQAIQRAIDLPVFSWGTLLDYANSIVAHRSYYGHV